jgi:hypothetical protein
MRLILIALTSLALTGCATFFKSSRQQVFFNGGSSDGVTTVQTPDGKFELDGGTGSYLMTRTKSDVPITVTCPGAKSKTGIVETKFDWLVAGGANLLFWPALFVDPWNDKAYDLPPTIQLGQYCNGADRAVSGQHSDGSGQNLLGH